MLPACVALHGGDGVRAAVKRRHTHPILCTLSELERNRIPQIGSTDHRIDARQQFFAPDVEMTVKGFGSLDHSLRA